ncbi:hypothetical protein BDV33DRAFT_121206 [Aspergillus novoparasiticus]|uniref:Uncharacterized protein n=1 Tax=Aspergillus novoparasiticus TaxID=986946 RepID=A0A5N6EM09_9EURO|nr:hypothetical protein BDV33DRAFT_121206 [Aspergillus novoparasiticus]
MSHNLASTICGTRTWRLFIYVLFLFQSVCNWLLVNRLFILVNYPFSSSPCTGLALNSLQQYWLILYMDNFNCFVYIPQPEVPCLMSYEI